MYARKESELLFVLLSFSAVLRSEWGSLITTHLQWDNVKTAKDTVQLEKKKRLFQSSTKHKLLVISISYLFPCLCSMCPNTGSTFTSFICCQILLHAKISDFPSQIWRTAKRMENWQEALDRTAHGCYNTACSCNVSIKWGRFVSLEQSPAQKVTGFDCIAHWL